MNTIHASRVGRSQRAIGFAATIVFLLAGAVVVVQTTDVAPASATTSHLVTGTSVADLAAAVAHDSFPTGASTVVVAQDTDSTVLLGATYAARHSLPLLVTESGTSATNVLDDLIAFNTSSVILVADSPTWFSTEFTSTLNSASIAVEASFDAGDAFSRWSSAAGSSPLDVIVVAHSGYGAEVNLASALAFGLDAPMVLWDSATSGSALDAFFAAHNGTDFLFVAPTDVLPYSHMSDDQVLAAYEVDVSDPDRAFAWIAAQVQARGLDSNSLVVAPSNSLAAIGIAGLVADETGGLLGPAGSSSTLVNDSRADTYLGLWKSEAQSVRLVGVGLTSADLSTVLAPTLSSHAVSPSFRVTNVAFSGATYSYEMTPVSGATSYSAFDNAGELLASSPTNTISFSTQINSMVVTAQGPTGELARFQVRLNDYSDAAARRSAIVGSSDNGTNHLVFLGGVDAPRLISRTVADLFSMESDPSAPVAVAITCGDTFTETGMDATKQYAYIVEEMTNVDAHACDPAHTSAEAVEGERIVGQVTFPPTSFPWQRGPSAPAVQLTAAEMLLAEAGASGGSSGESRADPSPLFFRWTAYIPEQYVLFPGYSGDPARPFVMYAGDNVTYPDPNISTRFSQTIYMFFGATNHGIVYAETMGTTHLYKCSGVGVGCSLVASATAPLSELSQGGTASTATTGVSGGIASATNPLSPVGVTPPIDVSWQVAVRPSRIMLTGYHDNMPKHEMWFGVYPGHAYLGYSSPYLSAAQLPCLFSWPGAPASYCSVYFNMQL